MTNKILVDTSSLIDFMKYYHEYFSHYDQQAKKLVFGKIFDGLLEFLLEKIKTGEIVVVDKVYEELRTVNFSSFKEEIKNSVVSTIEFLEDVGELIEKYRVAENEKFYNSQGEIENALQKYEREHADLFLIACANKLKSEGHSVLLITEETRRDDQKLLPKIPVICREEKLKCRNVPFALFDFYKNELNFNLIVN